MQHISVKDGGRGLLAKEIRWPLEAGLERQGNGLSPGAFRKEHNPAKILI